MPTRPRILLPGKQAKEHIAQAQDNYLRYQRLSATTADDGWALVVLFYAALHLVQAHALTKYPNDTPPENHQERRIYVADNLGRLYGDYLRLQHGSELVRYSLWYPTHSEVEPFHDQAFKNIRKHLATIGIVWSEPED